MATNAADAINVGSATGAAGRFADRWIFVLMAMIFVAVTLLGFIPDSVSFVGMVRAHILPPIPVALHFHAVLMGSWLLLLLAQSTLIASGRRTLHRQLGLLSLVLLPAIVVAGVFVVRAQWQSLEDNILSPPAGVPSVLIAQFKGQIPNILLTQIRMLVVFSILVVWALLLRTSDSQTHKRLMFLATVIPLGAGTGRALDFLGMPQNF